MNLVPKIIDRSRGDYLSSEEFNRNSQDLYGDLVTLLDRELELYGKSKILSEALEATNIGYVKAASSSRVHPVIPIDSDFYFPADQPPCVVDKVFEEITLPVESRESQILTDDGKVRDIIAVRRTSDNFIFSKNPESVSESRILDCIEESNYPYLIRVRGVDDVIKVKLVLESDTGSMECNSFDFIPAPYIGGTSLEYLNSQEATGSVVGLVDPAGKLISMAGVPKYERFRPLRLHFVQRDRISFQIGIEGDIKLESTNISLAGLYKIKVEKRSWASKGFIGFRIPADPGRTLKSIKPVTKWNNTYLGSITFRMFSSMEDMMSGSPIIGSFKETGEGIAVQMDSDIWVMAEIQSRINASPQFSGFTYETIG